MNGMRMNELSRKVCDWVACGRTAVATACTMGAVPIAFL